MSNPPQARAALDVAAVLATTVGSSLAVLDSTVVNTALPALADDLDLGLAGLQWVVTAYALSLAALLLVGGSLGDRFGRRRTFVWGLWAFAITTTLCGIAPSGPALIVARLAQGAAAAVMIPNSLATLSSVHEGAARARAIGIWTGGSAVAAAVGPLVGGALTDALSWRAAFLIAVPLCVVAAVAARGIGAAADARGDARPAILGGLLAAIGLGTLTYGLIDAGEDGLAPASIAALAIAVVATAAFAWHEARVAAPLVPRALWRARAFGAANIVTVLIYGGFGGALFLLGLYLQTVAGYSALAAGAATLPLSVLLAALASRAGAVARRVGVGPLIGGGSLLIAASLVLLARAGTDAPFVSDVLPGISLFGLGLALIVAPITSAALDVAPVEQQGAASGVNIAAARVGSLLAVAALGPLVAWAYDRAADTGRVFGSGADGVERLASADAYGFGMYTMSAICVLGGLIAFAVLPRTRG